MDALTRFFMDPLVKPEDDEKEAKPDDDERVVWFYYENIIYHSLMISRKRLIFQKFRNLHLIPQRER